VEPFGGVLKEREIRNTLNLEEKKKVCRKRSGGGLKRTKILKTKGEDSKDNRWKKRRKKIGHCRKRRGNRGCKRHRRFQKGREAVNPRGDWHQGPWVGQKAREKNCWYRNREW